MNSINRRNFLTKGTLAASLGPSIIPSSVLGKDAPSNKITVGFIGTGGHGTGWNLPSYLSQNDAKVLMTCDVDTNRMNHAKKLSIKTMKIRIARRPKTSETFWRETILMCRYDFHS